MALPPTIFDSTDFSDTGVWTLVGSPTHGSFTTPSTIIANTSLIGDGVGRLIKKTSGAVLTSGAGNKHTFLVGFKITNPNADATILAGQLNDGNNASNNHFQISMQALGTMVGLFRSGSGLDTLQSRSDVDISDGIERICLVTVNGDTPSVKIYLPKTTDMTIYETTYQIGFNSVEGGSGYSGPIATPPALSSGGSISGNQLLLSGEQTSILRIWNSEFTAPQLQEAFNEVVVMSEQILNRRRGNYYYDSSPRDN